MNENINPALSQLAVPISSLKLDARNARAHDERSINTIANSLRDYGQQKPIIVIADGTVIAGNGTLSAAKELGWEKLAVVRFTDEAKARAFAIADNRSAELSTWNEAELAATLKELQQMTVGAVLGFSDQEIADLLKGQTMDGVVGPTPAEKLLGFNAATVKQISLFFEGAEYDTVIARLDKVSVQLGTVNNTQTFVKLLEHYEQGASSTT